MTAKFDGFSEEEINKINSKPKKAGLFAAKSLGVGRVIRRVPDKQIPSSISSQQNDKMVHQKNNRNSENGAKISKTIKPNDDQNGVVSAIDYNRQISDESLAKLHQAVLFQPLAMKQEAEELRQKVENADRTDDSEFDKSILHLSDIRESTHSTPESGSTQKSEHNVETLKMSPFRGVSLKDFESQRKIREEQNKMKKEMLYKAIEKHTQKTAAEVKKIEEIKDELARLDQDLAADVAILRKQIETACIHYSHLEKHYDKIEQMFLKAKHDLYQASEKKELLTEHLCTVITHNEDRKAKKLTELMEKVGLSPASGEVDISEDCMQSPDIVDK